MRTSLTSASEARRRRPAQTLRLAGRGFHPLAVRASQSPLKLILCGSAISFMEELLAERNPLHGRQSAELELAPLPFREAAEFFPGWSADDRLRAYGVFGGMPYYLSLCDPARPLAENIRDRVLVDGAPLREEPEHLLQAELQNVARAQARQTPSAVRFSLIL